MTRISYAASAEDPDLRIWWFDDDGTLINFTGYTFALKIGAPGAAALLTKTTGITGAAGAGTEPTGTPNVVVRWEVGELALTPGTYTLQLTPSAGGRDRDPIDMPITIRAVIA